MNPLSLVRALFLSSRRRFCFFQRRLVPFHDASTHPTTSRKKGTSPKSSAISPFRTAAREFCTWTRGRRFCLFRGFFHLDKTSRYPFCHGRRRCALCIRYRLHTTVSHSLCRPLYFQQVASSQKCRVGLSVPFFSTIDEGTPSPPFFPNRTPPKPSGGGGSSTP